MLRSHLRLHTILGSLLFSVLGAAPALAQAQVPMTTTRVASGLTLPLYVTAPVGDTARLFIVEQRSGTIGRIRILNLPGNTLNATPYLSISPVATGNEQGLLGLAFHPDFANNGFFYVDYTNSAGTTVIQRYTATAPFLTSTTADPASAQTVLTIAQPFSNHNGGWIGFGPDGYLYIAMGDGGSGNDPNGNGQNINVLLGKMLRIDVNGDDFPADVNKNYAIPSTNPFAGAIPGSDEIWHYGLRNPWRNSFDRQTGDMWIGDVGQNAIEEVDFVPAGQGGLNFGWRCMEGLSCTGLTGCTCNGPTLTLPVQTYTHSAGCSITGGYCYRGTALCGVQGSYFYTDYCTPNIFTFRLVGGVVTALTNRTTELAPGGGLSIATITSFGEDASGELYIVDQGGEVFKVIPRPTATTDCNGNAQWDVCDIQNGTSIDANTNLIPDECEFGPTPYCFGDGGTIPCPCNNDGLAGNGCANSAFPAGARLSATGVARVSADTINLSATDITGSIAIFFQGGSQLPHTVIDDGIGCVGGPIIRLGNNPVGGSAAIYPDVGDALVSVRGGVPVAGGTFYYQCFYRNAVAAFCPPATSNRTNGLTIVWAP